MVANGSDFLRIHRGLELKIVPLFCLHLEEVLELPVALSELDRGLIKDCVEGSSQAWTIFCDRFAGLVMDVVDETLAFAGVSGQDRSLSLREELAEGFFREVRSNGFELIRTFRGESSLATYMAVVARRWILGALSKRKRSD
jgi:RNA polymerase sigma-70 factor (ECF subfamily)